jgi:integrase
MVTLGYEKVETENGPRLKRKTLNLGYFEKRKDALDTLVSYNKKPIGGLLKSTLQDIYDNYAKNYPSMNKKTVETYVTAWRHLKPIADTEVREIKKSHLQAIIDDMTANGLSQSSTSKVKVLAGILLDKAMEDDIVDKNYAKFVDIPRQEKKEKAIFTDAHIKKLFDNSTDKWVQTVLILIYTGLRIGELLTLTKFDVDMKEKTITGGIKTDAGKDRVIPIHSKIQPFIESWLKEEGEYFISKDSKRVTTNRYRKVIFHPMMERLEIEGLTPHAARHTFATLLSRAKVDTLSIQRVIGHSKYSTTADIYTRSDTEELRKAVESI